MVQKNLEIEIHLKITTIKTKEHNNRHNLSLCIRNMETKKERQKANHNFWKESVQKNFRNSK